MCCYFSQNQYPHHEQNFVRKFPIVTQENRPLVRRAAGNTQEHPLLCNLSENRDCNTWEVKNVSLFPAWNMPFLFIPKAFGTALLSEITHWPGCFPAETASFSRDLNLFTSRRYRHSAPDTHPHSKSKHSGKVATICSLVVRLLWLKSLMVKTKRVPCSCDIFCRSCFQILRFGTKSFLPKADESCSILQISRTSLMCCTSEKNDSRLHGTASSEFWLSVTSKTDKIETTRFLFRQTCLLAVSFGMKLCQSKAFALSASSTPEQQTCQRLRRGVSVHTAFWLG